jgi:hypothetical protein
MLSAVTLPLLTLVLHLEDANEISEMVKTS